MPMSGLPIQELRSPQLIEVGDLSGYVRDMTLVLLLDLGGDIEIAANYLMPLWDLLSNYRLEIDHSSLARQIERAHGIPISVQYEDAVSRWREHRKHLAARNRPN
jgi:hypothetical protein